MRKIKLLNSERLNNLPEAAQLVGGAAALNFLQHSPSSLTPSCCSGLSHTLPPIIHPSSPPPPTPGGEGGGKCSQKQGLGLYYRKAWLQIPAPPDPALCPGAMTELSESELPPRLLPCPPHPASPKKPTKIMTSLKSS